MRAPVFGLALHLWMRHRLGFLVILAYLGVEVIAALTIPRSLWSRESAGASAAIPLTMIAMYLMAAFVNTEADFASPASGYPGYLLTLPIRTRDLALWPMAFGCLATSGLWIASAAWIFRTNGIHAPLWWPAAMLGSTVACLQAIIWSPIPLAYLRTVLAVALLPAMVFLGVAAFESGVSEAALVIVYVSAIPIAFLVAQNGLARARCGQTREWSWIPIRGSSDAGKAAGTSRRFTTPARAQLWMDWKRNGMMLPLLVGSACAVFSLPLLFIHERGPLRFAPPGAELIEANVYVSVLTATLGLPLWFAMVLGAGGRKADVRRSDLTLQPFFAARPMTSIDLVMIRMKVAALGAVAAWGTLLIFVGFWLLMPAKEGSASAPLGVLLLQHLTLRQGLILALGVFGAAASTWRMQVESLWIDYGGNRWLVHGSPIAFGILVTAFITFGANCIGNPELVDKMLRMLPGAAWALAALKLTVRGLVLRAVIKSRIITSRIAITVVALWLAVALGLLAVLHQLIPPGAVPAKYLALGVFLAMPFARVAAAPAALERNRHR